MLWTYVELEVVIYLTNSNKVRKIDNVDLKIKHLSLFQNIEYFIFTFYLDNKKQKNQQILYLSKKNFGVCQKNKNY